MRRSTTDNSIENGDGNTQVGNNSGTIISGIDPELFIAEMRRKDDRIDELISRNEALTRQVGDLEREKIEAELSALRKTKEELAGRLANPERALREHKARATQIEALLDDVATTQAVGENRIRSALEGFADLEYAEIDSLLDDIERQGILQASRAAYGRGLVAEDAIQWADAAAHYARAARLDPSFDALRKASEFARRSGDYAAAERHSRDLLDLARKEGTPEQHASALNEHALNNRQLGRYAEAEALYREALEIGRATIGTRHPVYANRLNNLGNVVLVQGRLAEAEALFREALEIDRETIGTRHPEYAIHLNNLGNVVRDQGRLAEAEALYREALEIGRETLGTRHPAYAIHLNNLGLAVEAQGRLAEAEALYREALEIDRETLGTRHPDYAIGLNNLGNVVRDQGRLAEAEALYREALEIFAATLPPEHPHVQQLRETVARFDAPDP